LKQSSDFDLRMRNAPKLRLKNFRLAKKYYKFGWDSASRQKFAERRRLTKFGAAVLSGGAGVYY